MIFPNTYAAMNDLCVALGIDPRQTPVYKIVLEFELDSYVKCYIKGPVKPGALPKINGILRLMAVEEVQVADDCTVTHTPRA